MQLLQELLILQDELEIFALLEDLGNLKQIDKLLLKALFNPKATYRDDEDKTPKIRDAVGRGSKIEPFKDKDADAALARLKDQSSVVAIILQYEGEQLLIVISNHKSTRGSMSYKDKPTYMLAINSQKFFKVVPKEELQAQFSTKKYNRHTGKTDTESDSDVNADLLIRGTNTDVLTKIKKLMKLVYDAGKKNKVAVETLAVTLDTEREKTGTQRAVARSGTVPLPTGNRIAIGHGKYSTYEERGKSFFKNLRSDLVSRLEKFKASKAKTFDTPDDLLKALIDEGYFDKVKLMGYSYQIGRSQFDLDKLRGKSRSSFGENYIEYKIQSDTPEHGALQVQLKKIRDDLYANKANNTKEENDSIYEKYQEQRDKIIPPGEFRVELGLEGGKIIPKGIQLKKDTWLY